MARKQTQGDCKLSYHAFTHERDLNPWPLRIAAKRSNRSNALLRHLPIIILPEGIQAYSVHELLCLHTDGNRTHNLPALLQGALPIRSIATLRHLPA